MQSVQMKQGTIVEQNNLVQQIWFKYSPYWPLFVLFLSLGLTGAWMYLRYKAIPVYEANAVLLINDSKRGQDNSQMIESLDVLSSKNIVENEIEVIKSKSLMLDVVKKLNLYGQVFEKSNGKEILRYETSPISIEASNPDSIIESGKVFFSYSSTKNEVIFNNTSYPANKWVTTKYGLIKFNLNSTDSINNEHLFFCLSDPKSVAASLAGSLTVEASDKASTVLNLSMVDGSARRAELILNELISAYNNSEIKSKRDLAEKTLLSLDQRIGSVKHDLDSVDQKLQQYKSGSGAVDISSQGALFLQNVSSNDQKLNDINYQLTLLDQVEQYIKSKNNNAALVPSTSGLSDPLLSQLLGKLYDSELEYEKRKSTTAENNPIMISINDQIEKIKPSILDQIRNQRQSLEANKNNLNQTNSSYSSIIRSIPQKERDIIEISRQQNTKSEVFNFLLQKREQATLSLLSSETQGKIIDSPQSSDTPISPNKKKIFFFAIFISLLLAFGLVTIRELFKRTILYRHEIESYTSVPVIGEIVYEKSKTPLVIGNGKRTFIAEQFRSLRTSLPYMGLKADKKRLQVTSSVSGEGKSFVVANLGIGLAMTGKKVIVLEFDLSDPTLSQKLGITEINKGLTDFLTDQAEVDEIINKTSVHENLHIISAGWLPENPTELIMSKKVPELIKYLSDIFDYIIIDTAPVGLLSDAYILSEYCDATLYVVRHKHTRKISIQRLDENNKINELKNMAIVFNGVKPRGIGRYGYGYGYGYIYKEKKKKKSLISKAGLL